MSTYYRNSGLTWEQYLQADSFVQDITGSVKRSGERVTSAVSDQTRQIVGSLESGFGRMEYGLEQIAYGIEDLRAEFSYGMGLIVSQRWSACFNAASTRSAPRAPTPLAQYNERILSIQIRHIIILPKVLAKLETKHNIKENEVKEIFRNRKTKYEFVEEGHFQGEDVYSASGQTEAGRYLVVFFIKKPQQTVLCISARDMDRKEKRRYGRK